MKVCGILGGTFDPVHCGHLALAEAALAALPLDEVLWLPSGSPGHRGAPVAPARDRLAMLRLATAEEPHYRIDAAELERSEQTFTVHVLARLRERLGQDQPIVLILGSDSFLSLPTWLRWRELFAMTHFAVASRPGHVLGEGAVEPELAAEIERRAAPAAALAAGAAGAIARLDMPAVDISSSMIRAALASGAGADGLLPAAVLAYIRSHGLYR